jgi:hypothetical protein
LLLRDQDACRSAPARKPIQFIARGIVPLKKHGTPLHIPVIF